MTLRQWRTQQRLTLNQLGDAVNASHAYLSQIECGTRRPSPELAKRIELFTRGAVTAASLLGVSEPAERMRGVREDTAVFAASEQLTISLTVSADQARVLRDAGADAKSIARAGAERALREAEAKAWADANREAIDASNAWIEKYGTFAEQLGLI